MLAWTGRSTGIADAERAVTVVCEGGGTQTMGKSLRRWAARVRDV
ncbi:MAG: hypothetical protein AB1384_05610 [Actinomycetota bacterium]